MSRSPKFQQTPRADVLTENEARTLEAIGRGENPCARVGEELARVTGARRRAVGSLHRKGYVTIEGDRRRGTYFSLGENNVPVLTDKGRTFIEGRAVEESRTLYDEEQARIYREEQARSGWEGYRPC